MKLEVKFTPQEDIIFLEGIDIKKRKLNIKYGTIATVEIYSLNGKNYILQTGEAIQENQIICKRHQLSKLDFSNEYGLFFDNLFSELAEEKTKFQKEHQQ